MGNRVTSAQNTPESDILEPHELGAAKLVVRYKQTGSLVQANWEFGAAKLGGCFFNKPFVVLIIKKRW